MMSLTVGQLRKKIALLNDDMLVVLRAEDARDNAYAILLSDKMTYAGIDNNLELVDKGITVLSNPVLVLAKE